MTHRNQSSNPLAKIFGSAALVGFVTIVALVWQVVSSHSEGVAREKQLANQATQIAKQDIQIALSAEQNRLLAEQMKVAAREASIDDQLRGPLSTNSIDFAPTATGVRDGR